MPSSGCRLVATSDGTLLVSCLVVGKLAWQGKEFEPRCTGNVLYALCSRAIGRAVATSARPGGKALAALTESLKAADEYGAEIPASIQAVVTKVTSGSDEVTVPDQDKD